MEHLRDNGGCGFVALLALIVCFVVISFELFREWRVGYAGQSYAAVEATIFNINGSDENFMPGLRYSYGGEKYERRTFYSGGPWPFSLSSWHQVKNALTTHAREGHRVEIYVYTKNPKYFALANTPSRRFYQYIGALLAAIMVFGGIIWSLYVKRDMWITIEDW